MEPYYAYIRVSTVRQGERGSSLQEQRNAIESFARKHGYLIAKWFIERETAAVRGRPVFAGMLSELETGAAKGLILHKIDRGARNLRDWSDLGQLVDRGLIRLLTAHEDIDLASRGGRLSADIQAVVAADYIRNLREEVKKGFYGRLKQGVYPLPAPLGYLDMGAGVPKKPDPVSAPLVRQAFELYATGNYSVDSLREELFRRGLRAKRSGKPLPNSTLLDLLRNPFYLGLIRIVRTKETFQGAHKPIISKSLFDRVQARLDGKGTNWTQRHSFLFRRLIQCSMCHRVLTGEKQKGFVYYRCHSRDCARPCIREDKISDVVRDSFNSIRLNEQETAYFKSCIEDLAHEGGSERQRVIDGLRLRDAALDSRLVRLTDAYIDRAIDRDTFEVRKRDLLTQKVALSEELTQLEASSSGRVDRLSAFFELSKAASLSYEIADSDEKRLLIQKVISNLKVGPKNVAVELYSPFQQLAKRPKANIGGPYRNGVRTSELRSVFDSIVSHFTDSTLNPHGKS